MIKTPRLFRLIARLFIIRSRWEAVAVIYALGLGAVDRGIHYLESYPGVAGWIMFAACTAAVFMAGARLLEITRKDNGTRRRKSDFALAGNYIHDKATEARYRT